MRAGDILRTRRIGLPLAKEPTAQPDGVALVRRSSGVCSSAAYPYRFARSENLPSRGASARARLPSLACTNGVRVLLAYLSIASGVVAALLALRAATIKVREPLD